MIFDAIITVGGLLANAMLSLFPQADSGRLSTLNGGISTVRTMIAGVNWIFPVDTLFQVLAIIFAVEFGLLSIKLIRWLASLITVNFIH